jgi:formamidopyrimidine-DNA glycosylase
MPEGPEVRLVAEKLQQKLPGYYIVEIGMNKDYNISLPLPILIRGVTVKGKKIIFLLDHDIYVVNSLGMTGTWSWDKNKYSHLWFSLAKPDSNGNLIPLEQVYYDDMRKFGSFSVYKSAQKLMESFKSKVGPDLLGETVSYDVWLKVAKTASDKQVCQFLIDQKYFSGIGNTYRSEIAYHAKINPTRLMSSLSDLELNQLYTSSIQVLQEAYYQKRDAPANYKDQVYRKRVDPYGNPVKSTKCKDNRKIFWVPEIQR